MVKNPVDSAGDPETWVQFLGQQDPLKKEMATHSSILAWGIPWTEEPGELQSTRSQRSRTRLSDSTTISMQPKTVLDESNENEHTHPPTAIFLPRKFHGWRSLAGYSPWGQKQSDTTERLHFYFWAHRAQM